MAHTKEMNLVLSSDAKPRLKWTQDLHHRFVDAVNKLGGPEKATPKSLMRIMGVHGLTLYHLKSHLQKYRLGRSEKLQQTYQQHKQEEYRSKFTEDFIRDGGQEKINESLQIAQALQMQMEVQRKLHEQIEVQRHLQLRIEAQGKYLQSVLRRAQETLSDYSSCSVQVENAKAQLSRLRSIMDSSCPSSSLSVLTEVEVSMLKDANNSLSRHNRCSLESSLTSSENSWEHENEEKQDTMVLSLMEIHPVEKSGSKCRASDKKRTRCDIDLNCESLDELDSGPGVMIDLNHKAVELFDEQSLV